MGGLARLFSGCCNGRLHSPRRDREMRFFTPFLLVMGLASVAPADVISTGAGDVKITPVHHGSVMLEIGGKVWHVDPWSQGDYSSLPKADVILITEHPRGSHGLEGHRDRQETILAERQRRAGRRWLVDGHRSQGDRQRRRHHGEQCARRCCPDCTGLERGPEAGTTRITAKSLAVTAMS